MSLSHQSTSRKSITFESIAKKYSDYFTFLASSWTGHSPAFTAKDLAQEALYKAWQVFDSFDPTKGSLSTFMTTIAISVFKDMCKNQKNLPSESFDDAFKHSSSIMVKYDASDEEYLKGRGVSLKGVLVDCIDDLPSVYVNRLMDSLDGRQRAIVEKTFGVGESPWEQSDNTIASELGISRQTVITVRKKAIETMRLHAVKKQTMRCAA